MYNPIYSHHWRGNDPHLLLPLLNGDHICFSIQEHLNFAFNLINDKYIQLNAQFVLPAEEESHMISNVSTFIGDLSLVVKNAETGNSIIIKVSAQDHSVAVDNTLTIVKNKPVTVQIVNTVIMTIDSHVQVKDASAWFYVNTNILQETYAWICI